MNAEAADLIRRWNEGLTQTVSVRLAGSRDKRGLALERFLDALTGLANKVRFSREDSSDELPAIHLGSSVRWHAVPEGGELAPFLKSIEIYSSSDGTAAKVPEPLRSKVAGASLPADMRIYVAPQCPFCPHVLGEIIPIAFLNPLLHIAIIDGTLFPELAAEEGIRSVPTIILDGAFRWSGEGHTGEIVNTIVNRDPAQLSAKSLENFLKEGNAGELARMMIERRQVFPAIADILESPDWSIRLGAMVVVEKLAEENPELAEKLLDLLWERLQAISGPARGDVIYLFGLARPGSKIWIERLRGMLESEEEQEREAVREALEKLG